jgi:hypothetical protein
MVAIHRCSQFSMNPRLQYEQAIKQIICYLNQTSNKGLILRPAISRGLECHIDNDFVGVFSPDEHSDNVATMYHSCTGYIIWFMDWSSKLQAIISLLTTDVEYITLSTTLHDAIYVMQLLKELLSLG